VNWQNVVESEMYVLITCDFCNTTKGVWSNTTHLIPYIMPQMKQEDIEL